MQLIVKGIHSPDCNIEEYIPAEEGVFNILVQVKIGFDDKSSIGDIFSLTVCSVGWLSLHLTNAEPTWGRHQLILRHFSLSAVKTSIQRMISEIRGDNWDDAVNVISRYMAWEFEDYRSS